MTLERGDLVVIDFPQGVGLPPKRRPVVVVQSDRNNRRLANSIFATVTSNTRTADKEQTQFLIDLKTSDGKRTGLLRTSAVKCENLYTLPIASVRQKIGRLPSRLLKQLDASLMSSLGLS